MIEQGPRLGNQETVGSQETVDEAWKRLWRLIQPALTGYRAKLQIFSKKKGGEWFLAGEETPQEIAEEAMDRLKKELGFQPEESYEEGREERINSDHYMGIPRYFRTERNNIVFVRRGVYRGKDLEGEAWFIKNLEPMNLGRQIFFKSQEIIDRAREATVGKE